MAHASRHKPLVRLQPSSWPRRNRRRWLRANDTSAVRMLMSAIPSLPRSVLARLAEQMINRMDELDGDLDVELNGDEQDDDGDRRDVTYSEWHTRSPQHHAADHEVGRGEIVDGNDDDEPEEDVDAAHDDGCGPVYLNGHQVWGARDDDPGDFKPTYGKDQTLAPTGYELTTSRRGGAPQR